MKLHVVRLLSFTQSTAITITNVKLQVKAHFYEKIRKDIHIYVNWEIVVVFFYNISLEKMYALCSKFYSLLFDNLLK